MPELPSDSFRHIPGFPGYAVTDSGEVWSCLSTGVTNKYVPWKQRCCHPSGRAGREYLHVVFARDRKQHTIHVHKLVLLAFVGPRPEGCEARHMNGNRFDNRVCNLQWGTKQENSDDKRRHGTLQCGARNGQAKLSPSQVAEIRSLRPNMTIAAIATRFAVSVSQVKRILYRKSWVA